MNPNWFKINVLCLDVYPKAIHKLAKKLEIPVEQIADGKEIVTEIPAWKYIRREEMMCTLEISQIPHEPDKSMIEFFDRILIVCEPCHTLINRLDKFLQMEPTVILTPLRTIMQQAMTEEEMREMGPNAYEEDED